VRRWRWLLAAVIMAAAGSGGGLLAAAPASADTPAPYFQIVIRSRNLPYECVQGDVGGPLGSSVTQHYCDPTGTQRDQLWLPISLGGDQWKFQNAASQLCLEARFGAVSGQPVALWDCASTESNTRWQWGGPRSGSPPFPNNGPIPSRVSGSTGFCLDVPGDSTAIGLQLQLYSCNSSEAQFFYVIRFVGGVAIFP